MSAEAESHAHVERDAGGGGGEEAEAAGGGPEEALEGFFWIQDKREGFTPAMLTAENGDGTSTFEVTAADGTMEERKVRSKAIAGPVRESQLHADYDDMVRMEEVTQPAILYNMRHRFAQGKIYTGIGTILVSLNPYSYEGMDVLYGDAKIAEYNAMGVGEDYPPHVFGVMNAAYKGLVGDQRSQSLIISGESGAGKTEATKLCLRYLTRVSGAAVEGMDNRVLACNPILEAFGNAKTVRNNNSSRFGKWIEVQFDDRASIAGCRIVNYLLEKSRVVAPAQEERSYHIYYQLCAGLEAAQRSRFRIGDVSDFSILTTTTKCTAIDGLDDGTEFGETIDAMRALGFAPSEIDALLAVPAAVLQLGNAEFAVGRSGEESSLVVRSAASGVAVDAAASILGVQTDALARELVSRVRWIRGEPTRSPLTASQAADARAALSKALYARTFDWLVARVNTSMQAPEGSDAGGPGRTVGVLDIFGFEIFEHNSFEQLCINYCNEKLQQHFNRHVFEEEVRTYEAEEIDWKDISFPNNNAVVELFERKQRGLLPMLDDEVIIPRGSDRNFLERVRKEHTATPELTLGGGAGGDRDALPFGVQHYAGEVRYDARGFLDKNRDELYTNLSDLMASSSVPFIRNLFASQDSSGESAVPSTPGGPGEVAAPVTPRLGGASGGGGGGGGGGGKGKVKTQGGHFREQLSELMATLELTEPHYVRCIKPNSVKKPALWEGALVLQQLQYSGVFEAINVRQSGYPNRWPHADFYARFHATVNLATAERESLGADLDQRERWKRQADAERTRDWPTWPGVSGARAKRQSLGLVGVVPRTPSFFLSMCRAIVARLGESTPAFDVAGVKFGTSMVLCRSEQHGVLMRARETVRRRAARVIQRIVRGRRGRLDAWRLAAVARSARNAFSLRTLEATERARDEALAVAEGSEEALPDHLVSEAQTRAREVAVGGSGATVRAFLEAQSPTRIHATLLGVSSSHGAFLRPRKRALPVGVRLLGALEDLTVRLAQEQEAQIALEEAIAPDPTDLLSPEPWDKLETALARARELGLDGPRSKKLSREESGEVGGMGEDGEEGEEEMGEEEEEEEEEVVVIDDGSWKPNGVPLPRVDVRRPAAVEAFTRAAAVHKSISERRAVETALVSGTEEMDRSRIEWALRRASELESTWGRFLDAGDLAAAQAALREIAEEEEALADLRGAVRVGGLDMDTALALVDQSLADSDSISLSASHSASSYSSSSQASSSSTPVIAIRYQHLDGPAARLRGSRGEGGVRTPEGRALLALAGTLRRLRGAFGAANAGGVRWDEVEAAVGDFATLPTIPAAVEAEVAAARAGVANRRAVRALRLALGQGRLQGPVGDADIESVDPGPVERCLRQLRTLSQKGRAASRALQAAEMVAAVRKAVGAGDWARAEALLATDAASTAALPEAEEELSALVDEVQDRRARRRLERALSQGAASGSVGAVDTAGVEVASLDAAIDAAAGAASRRTRALLEAAVSVVRPLRRAQLAEDWDAVTAVVSSVLDPSELPEVCRAEVQLAIEEAENRAALVEIVRGLSVGPIRGDPGALLLDHVDVPSLRGAIRTAERLGLGTKEARALVRAAHAVADMREDALAGDFDHAAKLARSALMAAVEESGEDDGDGEDGGKEEGGGEGEEEKLKKKKKKQATISITALSAQASAAGLPAATCAECVLVVAELEFRQLVRALRGALARGCVRGVPGSVDTGDVELGGLQVALQNATAVSGAAVENREATRLRQTAEAVLRVRLGAISGKWDEVAIALRPVQGYGDGLDHPIGSADPLPPLDSSSSTEPVERFEPDDVSATELKLARRLVDFWRVDSALRQALERGRAKGEGAVLDLREMVVEQLSAAISLADVVGQDAPALRQLIEGARRVLGIRVALQAWRDRVISFLRDQNDDEDDDREGEGSGRGGEEEGDHKVKGRSGGGDLRLGGNAALVAAARRRLLSSPLGVIAVTDAQLACGGVDEDTWDGVVAAVERARASSGLTAAAHRVMRREQQCVAEAVDDRRLVSQLRSALATGQARGPLGRLSVVSISTAALSRALVLAGELGCRTVAAELLAWSARQVLRARQGIRDGEWSELRAALREADSAGIAPEAANELERYASELRDHDAREALTQALSRGGLDGEPGDVRLDVIRTAPLEEAIATAKELGCESSRAVQLQRTATTVLALRRALTDDDGPQWDTVESILDESLSSSSQAASIATVARGEVDLIHAESRHRRGTLALQAALQTGLAIGSVGALDTSTIRVDDLDAAIAQAAGWNLRSTVARALVSLAELVRSARTAALASDFPAVRTLLDSQSTTATLNGAARVLSEKFPEVLKSVQDEITLLKREAGDRVMRASLIGALESGGATRDAQSGQLEVAHIRVEALNDAIALADQIGPETPPTKGLLDVARIVRRLRAALAMGSREKAELALEEAKGISALTMAFTRRMSEVEEYEGDGGDASPSARDRSASIASTPSTTTTGPMVDIGLPLSVVREVRWSQEEMDTIAAVSALLAGFASGAATRDEEARADADADAAALSATKSSSVSSHASLSGISIPATSSQVDARPLEEAFEQVASLGGPSSREASALFRAARSLAKLRRSAQEGDWRGVVERSRDSSTVSALASSHVPPGVRAEASRLARAAAIRLAAEKLISALRSGGPKGRPDRLLTSGLSVSDLDTALSLADSSGARARSVTRLCRAAQLTRRLRAALIRGDWAAVAAAVEAAKARDDGGRAGHESEDDVEDSAATIFAITVGPARAEFELVAAASVARGVDRRLRGAILRGGPTGTPGLLSVAGLHVEALDAALELARNVATPARSTVRLARTAAVIRRLRTALGNGDLALAARTVESARESGWSVSDAVADEGGDSVGDIDDEEEEEEGGVEGMEKYGEREDEDMLEEGDEGLSSEERRARAEMEDAMRKKASGKKEKWPSEIDLRTADSGAEENVVLAVDAWMFARKLDSCARDEIELVGMHVDAVEAARLLREALFRGSGLSASDSKSSSATLRSPRGKPAVIDLGWVDSSPLRHALGAACVESSAAHSSEVRRLQASASLVLRLRSAALAEDWDEVVHLCTLLRSHGLGHAWTTANSGSSGGKKRDSGSGEEDEEGEGGDGVPEWIRGYSLAPEAVAQVTAIEACAMESRIVDRLAAALTVGGAAGSVDALDVSVIDVATLGDAIAAASEMSARTPAVRPLLAAGQAVRRVRLALVRDDWPGVRAAARDALNAIQSARTAAKATGGPLGSTPASSKAASSDSAGADRLARWMSALGAAHTEVELAGTVEEDRRARQVLTSALASDDSETIRSPPLSLLRHAVQSVESGEPRAHSRTTLERLELARHILAVRDAVSHQAWEEAARAADDARAARVAQADSIPPNVRAAAEAVLDEASHNAAKASATDALEAALRSGGVAGSAGLLDTSDVRAAPLLAAAREVTETSSTMTPASPAAPLSSSGVSTSLVRLAIELAAVRQAVLSDDWDAVRRALPSAETALDAYSSTSPPSSSTSTSSTPHAPSTSTSTSMPPEPLGSGVRRELWLVRAEIANRDACAALLEAIGNGAVSGHAGRVSCQRTSPSTLAGEIARADATLPAVARGPSTDAIRWAAQMLGSARRAVVNGEWSRVASAANNLDAWFSEEESDMGRSGSGGDDMASGAGTEDDDDGGDGPAIRAARDRARAEVAGVCSGEVQLILAHLELREVGKALAASLRTIAIEVDALVDAPAGRRGDEMHLSETESGLSAAIRVLTATGCRPGEATITAEPSPDALATVAGAVDGLEASVDQVRRSEARAPEIDKLVALARGVRTVRLALLNSDWDRAGEAGQEIVRDASVGEEHDGEVGGVGDDAGDVVIHTAVSASSVAEARRSVRLEGGLVVAAATARSLVHKLRKCMDTVSSGSGEQSLHSGVDEDGDPWPEMSSAIEAAESALRGGGILGSMCQVVFLERWMSAARATHRLRVGVTRGDWVTVEGAVAAAAEAAGEGTLPPEAAREAERAAATVRGRAVTHGPLRDALERGGFGHSAAAVGGVLPETLELEELDAGIQEATRIGCVTEEARSVLVSAVAARRVRAAARAGDWSAVEALASEARALGDTVVDVTRSEIARAYIEARFHRIIESLETALAAGSGLNVRPDGTASVDPRRVEPDSLRAAVDAAEDELAAFAAETASDPILSSASSSASSSSSSSSSSHSALESPRVVTLLRTCRVVAELRAALLHEDPVRMAAALEEANGPLAEQARLELETLMREFDARAAHAELIASLQNGRVSGRPGALDLSRTSAAPIASALEFAAEAMPGVDESQPSASSPTPATRRLQSLRRLFVVARAVQALRAALTSSPPDWDGVRQGLEAADAAGSVVPEAEEELQLVREHVVYHGVLESLRGALRQGRIRPARDPRASYGLEAAGIRTDALDAAISEALAVLRHEKERHASSSSTTTTPLTSSLPSADALLQLVRCAKAVRSLRGAVRDGKWFQAVRTLSTFAQRWADWRKEDYTGDEGSDEEGKHDEGVGTSFSTSSSSSSSSPSAPPPGAEAFATCPDEAREELGVCARALRGVWAQAEAESELRRALKIGDESALVRALSTAKAAGLEYVEGEGGEGDVESKLVEEATSRVARLRAARVALERAVGSRKLDTLEAAIASARSAGVSDDAPAMTAAKAAAAAAGAVRAEARAALTTGDEEAVREALGRAKASGLEVPETKAMEAFLALDVETRLRRRLEAAARRGDKAAVVQCTLALKSRVFEQHARSNSLHTFALQSYPRLRPRELYLAARGTGRGEEEPWLSYSEHSLPTSLTTLDPDGVRLAKALGRNMRGYCDPSLRTHADPRVAAQEICWLGVAREDLRDEIYLQLCKTLSEHPEATDGGFTPGPRLRRAWEVLRLAVHCFPPSSDLENILECFLRTNTGTLPTPTPNPIDPTSWVARAANQILHALHWTITQGPRKRAPRVEEIDAILDDFPPTIAPTPSATTKSHHPSTDSSEAGRDDAEDGSGSGGGGGGGGGGETASGSKAMHSSTPKPSAAVPKPEPISPRLTLAQIQRALRENS